MSVLRETLPGRALLRRVLPPGMNCIKIGLPGKLILSKRKGLREVIFSWKYYLRINFPGRPFVIQLSPDEDRVRQVRLREDHRGRLPKRGGRVQGPDSIEKNLPWVLAFFSFRHVAESKWNLKPFSKPTFLLLNCHPGCRPWPFAQPRGSGHASQDCGGRRRDTGISGGFTHDSWTC